jgi:hypothetical protein
MFEDLDRDDVANLAKIVGIIVFIVSFFLPAVTMGYAQSPADYLITSDAYPGWACAAWTLSGTAGFIANLFGPDRVIGGMFFYVISGWITPLVIIFALFPDHNKAKRIVAKVLPFLMVVPLLFFASAINSGWGPNSLRPLIGHYVWTVGCLLIFTPQYAWMLGSRSKERDEAPDEDSPSNGGVA